MNPERVPTLRHQPASVCGFVLLLLVLGPRLGQAQPSGGPYGPIERRYDLPKTAGRKNGIHNNWWQYIANPDNVGV